MELQFCTATLLRGSGQWKSCKTMPHSMGQWALDLLSCTATVLKGSGHKVVQLLQHITSLPRGSV